MATMMLVNIEEERVISAMKEAAEKLDQAGGEMVLDFVSVRRIDSSSLQAMEGLASLAAQKSVKVVLRGVNVDVYKVLKLVKLAPRFCFMV